MEENNSNLNKKQELWNLSMRDIFYKYVRFLPVIILSVSLFLLGAFVYLRYATYVYSASGTLLIKNQNSKNSGSTDRVEDILSGGNKNQNLQNEIELLKSRPLMTRVVKKLNLQFRYTAEGRVKDMNAYRVAPFFIEMEKFISDSRPFEIKIQILSQDQYQLMDKGTAHNFGQPVQHEEAGVFRLNRIMAVTPGALYTISWAPAETVAAQLVSNLKVLPKTPGTGILNISMEATSAKMAADVVDNLMVQYDSMTIEQNNYSTDQMLSFIDERLEKLKDEIDSIQLIELGFRQKENLFDVELQSSGYFATLADVNKSISEQELRVNTADNIGDYVKNKKNQFSQVVPSALGLEDLTLNDLVLSYNKAQMERQILLNSNIPPANPAIKEADEVIEKQRQNLLENLRNIKMGYLSTVGKLQQKITDEQGELKSMPYKIKELIEIQRQISTKLALYSLLEGKREETAISRASTISNSTIIDRAQPSLTPVKPNRGLIQILAIAFGLIVPVLFIFASELFNDKVMTRADIERLTDAPILGEIGHSYADDVMVVNKNSRSMIAEQFRIVRSNLQYIMPGVERPVILVTSSFSGEGKSFCSTNMASVMALTGKKTVILEFDIRKPKVLSGLKMGKRPGISNLLLGQGELENLVIAAPGVENLFILPCGPIPPNPAEILLDPRVAELFNRLREMFDVVIIDTAPVGMVSDAMTLSKFADCTLYLIRQGYTLKKQVALIDSLYIEKKLPKLSIVINDVKLKAGYGYYGYGRYGYGSGYGEKSGYYDEEITQKPFWTKVAAAINPLNWIKRRK